MSRRASSSYVRRKVLQHYGKPHPFIQGRTVMYCGGGKDNCGCDAQIDVELAYWEGEHEQPEALGGADEPPNTYPICAHCHKAKTKREAPVIAKAIAEKEKREGVRRTSKPMPFGKRSPLKQKMDGRIVPRE